METIETSLAYSSLNLLIWAVNLSLIPVWIWKKKTELFRASILLFFMLLIPVFMGLNTPNPNHVNWVEVAIP